jgi:energy-coupling factor transport system substrate-specific component
VVGALVIRKPGAALFTELVAAIVSALLGNQWGLTVVFYGLAQGIGPELVFLATRYRRWGLPTAVLAGAAAGVGTVLLDLFYWYPHWATGWMVAYAAVVITSAAAIAGVGGWWLFRALARTGVLAPFASGREQRAV